MARNRWFQDEALGRLRAIHRECPAEQFVLFAYSYAARRLFEFAKEAGWMTVLGQIDPGRTQEDTMAELESRSGSRSNWMRAPDSYWAEWRTECAMADQIVVNSGWSRQNLIGQGLPAENIRVMPLVYEPAPAVQYFRRIYPKEFTPERPLRILLLGQVRRLKGIDVAIDAADLLAGLPVEIHIVGSIQIALNAKQRSHPGLRWTGIVPRSEVDRYYREADLFLFPTHSDGFGLTQLEAQSWKLPLMVSRFCGEVVEDGVNGWVLATLSGEAIADRVRKLLEDPSELQRRSDATSLRAEHRFEGFAERLIGATSELTTCWNL